MGLILYNIYRIITRKDFSNQVHIRDWKLYFLNILEYFKKYLFSTDNINIYNKDFNLISNELCQRSLVDKVCNVYYLKHLFFECWLYWFRHHTVYKYTDLVYYGWMFSWQINTLLTSGGRSENLSLTVSLVWLYRKRRTSDVFMQCLLFKGQLQQCCIFLAFCNCFISPDYFPVIWKSLENIFISRCLLVKTFNLKETEASKSVKKNTKWC